MTELKKHPLFGRITDRLVLTNIERIGNIKKDYMVEWKRRYDAMESGGNEFDDILSLGEWNNLISRETGGLLQSIFEIGGQKYGVTFRGDVDYELKIEIDTISIQHELRNCIWDPLSGIDYLSWYRSIIWMTLGGLKVLIFSYIDERKALLHLEAITI